MERQLACIATIKSLTDAANSDNLSICCMEDKGWQVFVRKDEFKVGNNVIYIEIDSMLPASNPTFDFLTKGEKDYKLKTIRLRGNLSQGLIIPIPKDIKINSDDIAGSLGIYKYEPPVKFTGGKRGETLRVFPCHIVPKTDQERIQNAMFLLPLLANKPVWLTTKMDGMSSTFLWLNDEFTCCSHNYAVKNDPPSQFTEVAKKYDLANKLPKNLVLQGEVCGPNVQKNRMGDRELSLYVFDIYDVDQHKYLDFADVDSICNNLGIPIVPFEHIVMPDVVTFDYLMHLATNKTYFNGKPAEGLVIRSEREEWLFNLGRFSFKVISNEYLLKE